MKRQEVVLVIGGIVLAIIGGREVAGQSDLMVGAIFMLGVFVVSTLAYAFRLGRRRG